MSDESQKLGVQTFIYLIFITLLSISGYFNYLYFTKKAPNSKANASCESIEQLPEDVRALYVDKVEYNQLKSSYEMLEREMHTSPAVAVEKELKHQKSISMMPQQPKLNNKLKKVKDFAKCYDMENADYKISGQCRKDIISYVNKHQDAKYFEIIAIVDDTEFRLLGQIEGDPQMLTKLGTNKKLIGKMKKFTQRGLGKHRASEASWVIKSYTKQRAATYNANYELISKKGHKGVIVRAYE